MNAAESGGPCEVQGPMSAQEWATTTPADETNPRASKSSTPAGPDYPVRAIPHSDINLCLSLSLSLYEYVCIYIYRWRQTFFPAFKSRGRSSLDSRRESQKDHSRKDQSRKEFTRLAEGSQKNSRKARILGWARGRNTLSRGKIMEDWLNEAF